jgi:hypothetical protein
MLYSKKKTTGREKKGKKGGEGEGRRGMKK